MTHPYQSSLWPVMTNTKNDLLVQYGCGLSQPDGWLNYDSTPSIFISRLPFFRSLAQSLWQCRFQRHYTTKPVPPNLQILRNIAYSRALYGDITKGLNLPANSCRQVYASHVIEHLPFTSAQIALRNTRKILRKGGCFRLVVPNLRYYVDSYLSSTDPLASVEFCMQTGLGSHDWGMLLSRLRGDRHHIMYDSSSLRALLLKSGFQSVRQAYLGDSDFDFSAVEDAGRWQYPINIGFECIA